MTAAVEDRAWTLPAAAGVAALETTGLIAALAITGPRAAPYAIALLATKYPFCLAMLARRHGAYLVIWLWEFTALGAALLKPGLALSTQAPVGSGRVRRLFAPRPGPSTRREWIYL